jgi:signal transduction histidine kinase/ligand-binding sensor domain-containing protein
VLKPFGGDFHMPDRPNMLSAVGRRIWRLAAYALVSSVMLTTGTVARTDAREAPPTAQAARGALPTLSFRHFGVDEGLSSWRANYLLQDHAGYMWIATPNGLDRFDGYRVRTYRNDPADPRSLSSSYVSTMYEDHTGRLWVGTHAGLDVYDPASDQFDRKVGENVISSVNALYEDRAGALWIGTFGSGLYQFDPTTQALIEYRHDAGDPASLSSNNVNDIIEDRSGTLWIATLAGVNRFDRAAGGFATYRHDPGDPLSLSNDAAWEIYEDHAGTLWVGTDGGGLNRFDPGNGQFVAYRHDARDPNSLGDDRLSRIFEDERGALWVGTFSGGVSVLDPSHTAFNVAHQDPTEFSSLSNNSVTDIKADRSGLIWIATAGGVDIYDPQWQAYTTYQRGPDSSTSLASNSVTAVHEDRAGRLLVGTRDRGFDVFNRRTGQVAHFLADSNGQGLRSPFVWDITSDPFGAVWIATYGGGLYRQEPESGKLTAFWRDANNPHSLSDDTVTDLFVDRFGTLWIGTRSGGLNRLDPGSHEFTTYRHDPANPMSLSHDTVRGLAQDRSGHVWVGTGDGGLDRLDRETGEFTHFRHDPSDPSSLGDDGVYALHVDRGGVLWVGLQGAGVDRFQPAPERTGGTFVHYRERNGLASDEVLALLEDGYATDRTAGNIWVVTGRGLSRIDAQSRSIRSYGSAEGFPSAPYTRGHDTTEDGRLLLGSFNGLIDFDPRAAREDMYVPPIVFSDFLLAKGSIVPGVSSPLTRPIDLTDRVELGWTDRVISIEFAALSFRAPALNRYRYMLEGFDNQWTEVDSARRLVTYTNLDPGTYVFRVTGSNGSGVWNPTGRELTLIIDPPWWATWWFRGLIGALVASALGAAYVTRVHDLKAQQRRLEALVAQRTRALEEAMAALKDALDTRDVFLRTLAHDLKAPITSLAWHVQMLSRAVHEERLEPDALNRDLRAISIGAAEAVAAINELHDLTRLAAGAPVPLQLEQVDLLALTSQLISTRLGSAQHHIELSSTERSLTVRADRARLARVLDNLLDNATKYSPAGGEICVRIDREEVDDVRWAVLRVEDRGVGIPTRDLPHVFERYQRGSNVAQIAGEGLGLASARQVIKMLGGSIVVESHMGVGSTFAIRLPVR